MLEVAFWFLFFWILLSVSHQAKQFWLFVEWWFIKFFIFSGRLYRATFDLMLNIIAEWLAILVSNWTRRFKIYIKLWLWFKFFGNIWREIIIKSNPFVRNSLKTFGTISIELVWKLIFVCDLVNVVFWYHANWMGFKMGYLYNPDFGIISIKIVSKWMKKIDW